MSCKLTSPEFHKHKKGVLAILKEKVLDKSELKNVTNIDLKGMIKCFMSPALLSSCLL